MYRDSALLEDPRTALLRSLETWGAWDEPGTGSLLEAMAGRLRPTPGFAVSDALPARELLAKLPLLDRAALRALLLPVWHGAGLPPELQPGEQPAPSATHPVPASEARLRLERLLARAAALPDTPPPLAQLIAATRTAVQDAGVPDAALEPWSEALARALAREHDEAAPWRKSAEALAAASSSPGLRPPGKETEAAELRNALQSLSASPADVLEVRARLALLEGGSVAQSPPSTEETRP